MKALTYRSQAHPIHEAIQPVVSAFKHGNKRIALMRFNQLIKRLNLMYWEAIVVSDLIKARCK